MAHYDAGRDAPPAIQCPRCRKWRQPNRWARENGREAPANCNHIERPYRIPGYGAAWLCHHCAGEALSVALTVVALRDGGLAAAALSAAGLADAEEEAAQ
jgi:tagatose-1,6-bisphosphate aldolase non-catalytic subunit AgaZ/GatZ